MSGYYQYSTMLLHVITNTPEVGIIGISMAGHQANKTLQTYDHLWQNIILQYKRFFPIA